MAGFWLTKKMLLEALKMVESRPQSTMVMFQGDSEVVGDKHYTIMEISACGKKKTLREDYNKICLINDDFKQ